MGVGKGKAGDKGKAVWLPEAFRGIEAVRQRPGEPVSRLRQ